MERAFPIGFPDPTAMYLTFYVVTWILHVVFMNYVLAGTAYMAVGNLLCWRTKRPASTIMMLLHDWMPAGMSGAITAGVAPLLFLQVLYQKSFYTANLLLFHRWMSVVPVLIVGFYLLYLLKTNRRGEVPGTKPIIIGFCAFLCMGFTAWSWSENHLLGMSAAIWPSFYESGSMVYNSPFLWPRLGTWFFASFPTLALLLGWQVCYARRGGETPPPRETAKLGGIALAGLVLAAVCALLYWAELGPAPREKLRCPMVRPYLVVGAIGIGLQSAAWLWQLRGPRLQAWLLGLASVGLLLTLVAVAVMREAIRLAAVDITLLYDRHARAASVAGIGLFLTLSVVVVVLIVGCIVMVKRRSQNAPG